MTSKVTSQAGAPNPATAIGGGYLSTDSEQSGSPTKTPKKKYGPYPKPALEYALARGYLAKLGIESAHAAHHFTHQPVSSLFAFLGRPEIKSYTPFWQHVECRPTDKDIAIAMFNSQTRIAPRQLDAVRYVTIDVDAHGVALKAIATPAGENDIDWRLSRQGVRLQREHDRAVRVAAARDVLEELLARAPFGLIEATPRGWHTTIVLDRAVDPKVAAAIGAAIVDGIETPAGVGLEVFPKVRADGRGDMCAAPFLGPAFRCARDFVSREGKRKDAIEELLHAEEHDPADLAHMLGIDLEASVAAVPAVTVEHIEIVPEALREDVVGQLRKGAFAKRVRHFLDNGIGEGESREAVQRVTWAAKALGFADEDIVVALTRMFESPKNTAKHTSTARGRSALLGQVRSQLKYLKTLAPRMNSRAISARIDALIGNRDIADITVTAKEKRPCAESSGTRYRPTRSPKAWPPCGSSWSPATSTSNAPRAPSAITFGSSAPEPPSVASARSSWRSSSRPTTPEEIRAALDVAIARAEQRGQSR